MSAQVADDGHGVGACLMGDADGSVSQQGYLQVLHMVGQGVRVFGRLYLCAQVYDAAYMVAQTELAALVLAENAEFAASEKQPAGHRRGCFVILCPCRGTGCSEVAQVEFSLHLFHYVIASHYGNESECDACERIDDCRQGTAFTPQQQVLVHEGGEGRESAAEACDQDEFRGGGDMPVKR